MKYLILVLLVLIPAVAQDLPVSTIQEKSIHIQNAMEESKITIKDSWDHPDLERLRMGGDVYRDAPVLVPGSTWLSFISQSAIGSWNGSYAPMAIK